MKRISWLIEKKWLSIVLILCFGTIIFFSTVSSSLAVTEYEHLKIGLPTKISSIDPLGYPQLDRTELNVQMSFFDHLFRRNEQGEIVGHLAEGYQWINDTTLRIKLRRGVRFHNGDEFTASDVKWSIEDMINPDRGPGLVGVVKAIKKIKIVDRYTVDLITKSQVPILPGKLTTYTMMVSGKERSTTPPSEYQEKPMGTGPYKLVEWKKGKHLIVVRNEDYFLGVPKIKKITFYPIPDSNTRLSALKSGDIDIAIDIDPSQAVNLRKAAGFEVSGTASSRVEWVYMRTDIKPFNDRRVRQAVNYAINKRELVKELLGGFALPLGQPTPPSFFGHNPNVGLYEYNPAKAKRLLAAAGIPKNYTIYFSTSTVKEEKARVVAGYLENVGLRVKLIVKEPGADYADYMARAVKHLAISDWGNWSLMDIEGTLMDCFGCTDLDKALGRWSYYCDPRIEKLIKALHTVDTAKRLSVGREASKILHDEAAMIWLYSPFVLHGKRQGIPEMKARTDNTVRLKWIRGGGEY